MYNGIRIIDGHVHPSESFGAGDIAAFFAAHSPMTDAVSLCTVAHSRFLSLTPSALVAKAMRPESTYVFSALDMSEYYLHPDTLGARMAECGERLIAMGCDGIKMLEGKPQMRKMHPIPDFDAPVWDAFWAWGERKQVPILMHLNDPENFWDAANAPAFAVQQGWLYDDSYFNNEAQYAQMLRVLSRHPRLCISFAHFSSCPHSLTASRPYSMNTKTSASTSPPASRCTRIFPATLTPRAPSSRAIGGA